MLNVFFGLLAVLAGVWGILNWTGDLIHFFKGVGPISLFFAGIIAIIAGLGSKARPPNPKK